MKLHPLTHISVALAWAFLSLSMPPMRGLAVLGIWIAVSIWGRRRDASPVPAAPFLKMLAVAAFFLTLIRAVDWFPFRISWAEAFESVRPFMRIAVPVTGIMYLSRRMTSEELYSFLIDIRTPPVLILILFRVLWLVPRFRARMDEVIIAQKLRGLRIDSFRKRLMALLPTLSPIFSSMFGEISENAVAITVRGFLGPTKKSHLLQLTFARRDKLILTLALIVMVAALWL